MSEFISIGIQVLALVLAAIVAYRLKYYGLIFGVLIIWCFGIVKMELLMLVDTKYTPGVIGFGWVLYGWLFGVIWCLPFTIAKQLVNNAQKRNSNVPA